MIYDDTGSIIKWILVSDGTVLSDDLTLSGEHDIWFLKSANGLINSSIGGHVGSPRSDDMADVTSSQTEAKLLSELAA